MPSISDYSKSKLHLPKFGTDRIVQVYTGSFNPSTAPQVAGYLAYYEFPHGLNFTPFTKGLYSFDGGVTWYDQNSDMPAGGGSYTSTAIQFASAGNIRIYTNQLLSTNCRYKIIAFG